MTVPESPIEAPPEAAELGSASLEPPAPIVAGSYGTWRLTFTCGARGIATGGGLRLYTDSDTDWGTPQVHDPGGAEYLTVDGPRAAGISVNVLDNKTTILTVQGAPLAPGQRVSVVYGDRSRGGPGSRSQTFAEPRRAFLLDVDAEGKGRWTALPGAPRVAIVGGVPERLVVVAPSTVRPGEPFRLLVRAVDAWGNPALGWGGRVTLRGEGVRLPESAYTFDASKTAVWWLEGCAVEAPGVSRVEVTSGDGEGVLAARSNPILCAAEPGPYRVYWGDPHGGQVADASKIRDFFGYARDVAGISFAGYQRNDHVHSNRDYALQQAAEREYDEAGRFVPLPGYEWTGEPAMGGHHNVYFRRHGQPMRRNSHRGVADKSDAGQDLPHVRDLHRAYRGTDTLITPHVGGGHADLTYHEPTLEPALEMTSDHGTFEWFLRESLGHGYRMGFLGGSDSHNGRSGADTPGYQERRYAKGGLTALLAGELSLDGVHEALRARRCYATTGERMLLDVQAGGHLMGEEVRASAAPEIAVSVTGTAPLESVMLYRGVEPIYEHALERRSDARRVRVLWEGASRQTSYSGVIWDGELRLVGGGGGFGAIALLRFDSPRSRITQQTETCLRWHSVTCGYRSGFVIDLTADEDVEAVEAECVVRTSLITRPAFNGHGDRGETRMSYAPAEAITFRFSLAELTHRPRRVHLGTLDRWVTVSRAPAPGGAETARFAYVDPSPRPGLNPYWVRVVQEDQEMAWSSPIFVDYVAPARS